MAEGQQVVLYLSNGEHISFYADVDELVTEIEYEKLLTIDHDDGSQELIATAHIVYIHVEPNEDYDCD